MCAQVSMLHPSKHSAFLLVASLGPEVGLETVGLEPDPLHPAKSTYSQTDMNQVYCDGRGNGGTTACHESRGAGRSENDGGIVDGLWIAEHDR